MVVVSENAATILLLRGIQTGEVKDSVMVLQVWNQQVYGNVNEGWDECSVELTIPAINNW